MKVKIHRSITEVPQGAWDSIVNKDNIYCHHRYIETMEKSGINKDGCYYFVVYKDNDILAHACVYFITTELDLMASGAIKNIVRAVRKISKGFLMMRYLECGPTIAPGDTLSFKDGVDRAHMLHLISEAVEGLAKELRVKIVVFRDFYDKETHLQETLKRRGYRNIHNLPKAEIKIRWKSFDEYLDSMRSNYRCKIVKSMEKCKKAGISIQLMENYQEKSAELKRLYDNVYDQAKEVKRERLPEAFFKNLGHYMKGHVSILSATKDGKLIGYMLIFSSGKNMIPIFPGLDYACSKEYCIYFNLFYETLKLAIEKGMKEVDMGMTTLNPKRDMGSDVLALNMYIKHSRPLLTKIISVLFDIITPPDTTQPRNVFKESC